MKIDLPIKYKHCTHTELVFTFRYTYSTTQCSEIKESVCSTDRLLN